MTGVQTCALPILEGYTNVENDFENLKKRFKVGEYAIMKASNNKRVKILDVPDNSHIWIDYDGNPMHFLIKGFIPEIEYKTNKYNL